MSSKDLLPAFVKCILLSEMLLGLSRLSHSCVCAPGGSESGHISHRRSLLLGASSHGLLGNRTTMTSVSLLARDMAANPVPIPTVGLVMSTVLSMFTMAILAICLSELSDTSRNFTNTLV